MPIGLVLADDHAMFREGMVALLRRAAEIKLLAQAVDGNQLLEFAKRYQPDVAVTDLTMPGPDFECLLTSLRASSPATAVIVLTMHNEPAMASRTIRLGVEGYVVKEDAFQQVLDAIRTIRTGRRYVSPSVTAEILEWERRRATESELTDRERSVLRAIAAGDTTRRIASNLGISVKTVETHRAKLMRKLDARSAPELIRVAMERGLLGKP